MHGGMVHTGGEGANESVGRSVYDMIDMGGVGRRRAERQTPLYDGGGGGLID